MNNARYYVEKIERDVINRLREMFADTGVVDAYVEQYERESKRIAEQDRLIKLYGDGTLPMDRVEARLKELQVEREKLSAELAEAKAEVPVVEVHPSALRQFTRKLERVRQSIENEGTIHDRETFEAFRAAVSHIIVGDGPIDGDYEVNVVTYIVALTGEEAFVGKWGDQW